VPRLRVPQPQRLVPRVAGERRDGFQFAVVRVRACLRQRVAPAVDTPSI
jgi:hypothetical protein